MIGNTAHISYWKVRSRPPVKYPYYSRSTPLYLCAFPSSFQPFSTFWSPTPSFGFQNGSFLGTPFLIPDAETEGLVPAIAVGSKKGKKITQLEVLKLYNSPARPLYSTKVISAFDTFFHGRGIEFSRSQRVAQTLGVWQNALADVEEACNTADNVFFGVQVVSAEKGSGLGIGVADLSTFNPLKDVLGTKRKCLALLAIPPYSL